VYDLILLDVRKHLPGESLEFYEQIKDAAPWQCFASSSGHRCISRERGPAKSPRLIRRKGRGRRPSGNS
jgi:hypothetical protein